jgi:UDPglucose 6-dehydrogenase
VTFKGGTDDVRESPAIAVIRALLQERCIVSAYDPAGSERAMEILPASGIKFADSPYEAVQGADALLILTDWEEFRHLDLDRLRGGLNQPIVIDGRNLFDPKRMERAGLLYYSMGRPDPTITNLGSPQIGSEVSTRDNIFSAETLSSD